MLPLAEYVIRRNRIRSFFCLQNSHFGEIAYRITPPLGNIGPLTLQAIIDIFSVTNP